MESMSENGPVIPALSLSDIDTTINSVPRILDLRLAEALGFKRSADIRPLIERHKEALERLGGIFRTVRKNPGRGRPAAEFWLTKKQAVYITTKAETERATDITIAVVEVFDAATATGPLGPLAPEEETMITAYRSLGRDDQFRLRFLLTPPIRENSIPETRTPPFCAGCKAADFWRRGIDTDLDPNPLLSGPLTDSDLRVIKAMRPLVAREINRAIGLRLLDATVAMQKAFRPDDTE